MKKKLPSEQKILQTIYDAYDPEYPGKRPGENDPYIAIDTKAIASKLDCKEHLLFGYLYYYLDHKYAYETAPNTHTHLFAMKVGTLRHAVNFPYLAAILSGHREDLFKDRLNLAISCLALALAIAAIIAQVVTAA